MEGVDESFSNTFGNYILHGINEVVLPAEVSWFPQTIGWKLTLIVLIAFLVVGVFRRLVQRHRDRYRVEALKRLSDLCQHADRLDAARRVTTLLKATALHAYPRQTVANLTGEAWVSFLNNSTVKPFFSKELGELLSTLAYQPDVSDSLNDSKISALFASAERWIKEHQTEPVNEFQYFLSQFNGKIND